MLGAIALLKGGERVPIVGPKPRLVLGLLAVRAGEVVSVGRLCEELWGDDQPADPAGVLQSHVSRLRKLLRPAAEIVGRPSGDVLEAEPGTVDASRFESLGDDARRSSDPVVAATRLLRDLVGQLRSRLGAGPFGLAVRYGAALGDGEIVEFALDQIHALAVLVPDDTGELPHGCLRASTVGAASHLR